MAKPKIGTVWHNKHSRKVYTVRSLTDDSVIVQRKTDEKTFKLSLDSFAENYTLGEPKEATLHTLVVPEERHRFDSMVLYPECVQAIRIGMNRILQRNKLVEIWKIDKIEPKAKTIMSFYGPPGTGKTMAAVCIGREFGRPVMQVNYSQMVNCYHGETGKNLATAFKEAREANAILFFDEADSLVSKRLTMHGNRDTIATAINQERNIFMQELDRFEGVVILTTNFFKNYDEAILRRVAQHVQFKLPNQEMREKLFISHMPNTDRVRGVNWKDIAVSSKGLSGGDIFQVVVNAINAASLDPNPANWYLTQEHLLDEVHRVLETKSQHQQGLRPITNVIKDNKA